MVRAGEDQLDPAPRRLSWDEDRVAFKREYKFDQHPEEHEKLAFRTIRRVYLDYFNEQEPEGFRGKLLVSSQFLYDGQDKNDLSVFFSFTDWGGSGGTNYVVLAMKQKGSNCFTYGLRYEFSEDGKVHLTNGYGETGHKIIIMRDRQLGLAQEFTEMDSIYSVNTAE